MLNARSFRVKAWSISIQRHVRLSSVRLNAGQRANEPITSKQQPLITSNDEVRSLRLRQHGAKALPLPPVMDPLLLSAKEKYKQPKLQELDEPKSELQRELEMNPYAHALATPIRQCQLTSARLPSHFLVPFVSQIENIDPAAEPANLLARPKVHLVPDLELAEKRQLQSPSRTYVLAQGGLIEALSKRRTWTTLLTQRMMNWFALKTGKQARKPHLDWDWDGQTAEKLLVRLQGEVLKCFNDEGVMAQLGPLSSGLGVDLDGERERFACILRLRHSNTLDQDDLKRDLERTLDAGTRIFNLAELLGDFRLVKLAKPVSDAEWVVVYKSEHTLPLQLALLRLEAFISRSGS